MQKLHWNCGSPRPHAHYSQQRPLNHFERLLLIMCEWEQCLRALAWGGELQRLPLRGLPWLKKTLRRVHADAKAAAAQHHQRYCGRLVGKVQRVEK